MVRLQSIGPLASSVSLDQVSWSRASGATSVLTAGSTVRPLRLGLEATIHTFPHDPSTLLTRRR